MSGRYSGSPNSGVSFLSNILGISVSRMYVLLGTKYSIFGIILIVLNFLVMLSLITLAKIQSNKFINWMLIVVSILLIPVLVLSPTFTITALLLCGTGLIGIFSLLFQTKLHFFSIFLFILSIVMGLLLREDAFYGIVIFLLPTLIMVFLLEYKKINSRIYLKVIGSLLIIVTSVITIDKLVFRYVANLNVRYMEYINFQNVLNTYTPGSLKLHQAIISGDAMSNIWSNIDFIILRNWAYADYSIFGFQNMLIGSQFVSNYSGLSGLINSDFSETLFVMSDFLEPMSLILVLLFSIALFMIFFSKFRYQALLINSLLLLNYFFGFYYLAAVLRIPTRTSFPLLILAVLLVVIVNIKKQNLISNKNMYTKTLLITISILFSYIFHTQNEFGYFQLKEQNETKLIFSSQRNQELDDFSKNATYVGPVSYFPISNQGVFLKNTFWSTGERTLPLNWATYSPYWYDLAKDLDLNESNIYISLATKKNVYWVSDAYLAEILNYYMNDRNIYRGKLCSVKKLSGKDNAEIFTYQAKETDC
jgi:hypothetical protein